MGIGTYCQVWCDEMNVARCMGVTTTMYGSNGTNVHTGVRFLVLLLLMGSAEQVPRRRLGLGSMYYYLRCCIAMSLVVYFAHLVSGTRWH